MSPWLPSILLIVVLLGAPSHRADAISLTGQRDIHDPSRIHELDGRYYTYGTGGPGGAIVTRYSDDLTHWSQGPAAITAVPDWALQMVPENGGGMWAPDVVLVGSEYRMYYSVSSFGSQRSVIGLATNTTLDFNRPDYEWVDQGLVIASQPGSPYNAIDAGLLYEGDSDRLWLTFGSYWNGIYSLPLNPDTGKVAPRNPAVPINIARNPSSPVNAIEAAHLMEHDGWYYLVTDWDACCQGVNSTYNLRVGRGVSPQGPFFDRDGVDLRQGGGDLFLATEGDQIGPGHFSNFTSDELNYFSFHYYDGGAGGFARLGIEEFGWTYDGWPVAMRDLPTGDYNRDGRVDAADYTVWRDTLGSTNDLRADGSLVRGSAGKIDFSDYGVWSLDYGADYATTTTSTTVPEPATLILTAIAAAYLSVSRRPTHGAQKKG